MIKTERWHWMTRNMKRRSTRINREMGRVQHQAVVEKDIGIRDGLDARWGDFTGSVMLWRIEWV